jgi:CheY-like chemotaxis protein
MLTIERLWLAASDEMGVETDTRPTDDAGRNEPGPTAQPPGTSATSAEGQALGRESASPLVMLVDDDPATGFMYGVGLRALGFRVVVLHEVSAVFVEVEREVPDMVVLDFHLRGVITGVDVLENLRLDSRMSQVPAFILSNDAGDLDGAIDRAFAAGASAWLMKSRITPADLGVRISKALTLSLAGAARSARRFNRGSTE